MKLGAKIFFTPVCLFIGGRGLSMGWVLPKWSASRESASRGRPPGGLPRKGLPRAVCLQWVCFWGRVCLQGDLHLGGLHPEDLPAGGSASWASLQGVRFWLVCISGADPSGTTKAGSMHPTGMHSCCQ